MTKPIFADYSALSSPSIIVRRFDDKRGNRFYYFTHEDQVHISAGITSCFGLVSTERDAIEKWKSDKPNWRELLNAAADYGTIMHKVFGDIMLGKKIDPVDIQTMEAIAYKHGMDTDSPKKNILSFLKFTEDYKLKPLVIEGVLCYKDASGEYLSMTIDLLAEVEVKVKKKTQVADGVYQRGKNKGQPKMVDKTIETIESKVICLDFKSNFFEKEKKAFYETHKLQLIGAKKAVEQNFGIKVDQVYNFSPNNWREAPSYTLHEWDLTLDDYRLFDAYWELIKIKNYHKPSGKILVAETLESSASFQYISYLEYARMMLNNEKSNSNGEG